MNLASTTRDESTLNKFAQHLPPTYRRLSRFLRASGLRLDQALSLQVNDFLFAPEGCDVEVGDRGNSRGYKHSTVIEEPGINCLRRYLYPARAASIRAAKLAQKAVPNQLFLDAIGRPITCGHQTSAKMGLSPPITREISVAHISKKISELSGTAVRYKRACISRVIITNRPRASEMANNRKEVPEGLEELLWALLEAGELVEGSSRRQLSQKHYQALFDITRRIETELILDPIDQEVARRFIARISSFGFDLKPRVLTSSAYADLA